MESGTSVASASSTEERLMDQILLRASDWTLACDNALLNKLQELSDNLVRSSNTIVNECDQLMSNVDELQFKVTNVTNEFLLLSNTHFVENKIEEFQECELETKPSDKPTPNLTKAEKEAMLLDKMKEAIQVGVRTQQHHEKLRLQRSEEFCHKSVDVHPELNIGHIIGSSKFFSSRYCGLEVEMAQRMAKTTNSCVSSETSNSTSSTLEDSLPPVRVSPQPTYPNFGYIDNQIKNDSTPTQPSFFENTRIVDEGSLFATPKASRAASENLQDGDSTGFSPPPLPVLPKLSVSSQFPYIPAAPARPPSTPSASSESDEESPPDLASHLASSHVEHEDLFAEIVSTPGQESASQPNILRKSSTVSRVTAEQKVISPVPAPDDNRAEQQPIRSPTAKPVHKFMDATVISQLQNKLLSAGTLKPSTMKQPEESGPTEDSILQIPQKKFPQPPEDISTVIQQNKDTRGTTEQEGPSPLEISAVKQLRSEIRPNVTPSHETSAKDIGKSAWHESPSKVTTKQEPAVVKGQATLTKPKSSNVLPVKKSIFDDSDSDDEDDLLFSSKPLKSISKPKTSIFADLDETLKKNDDLFRPTANLDLRDSGDEKNSYKSSVLSQKRDPPMPTKATDTREVDTKREVEEKQSEAIPQQSEKHLPDLKQPIIDSVPKVLLQSTVITEIDHEKGPVLSGTSKHIEEDTTGETSNASVPPEYQTSVDPVFQTIPIIESESKLAVIENQGLPVIERMPIVNEAKQFSVFGFPKGVPRTPSSSSESSEGGEDIFDSAIGSEPPAAAAKTQVTATLDEPTPSNKADSVQPSSLTEVVSPMPSISGNTKQKIPSLFEDDADDDDIFKDSSLTLPKTYLPVRSSSPPPMPVPKNHTDYSGKPKNPLVGRSIFDSSDSDDDLFSTKKSAKPSHDNSSKPIPIFTTNLVSGPPANSDRIIDSVSTTTTSQPVSSPSASPVVPTLGTVPRTAEPVSVLTAKEDTPEYSKVPAEKRPSLSATSIKKEKSIFDSSDSDDDLFSTKTLKKPPSVIKSKPGPGNISVGTKPPVSKPKSSIFDDDSSDDSDDLFGKSKAKVDKTTMQSSMATSNKPKDDQPPSTADSKSMHQKETQEFSDLPIQPRTVSKIASAAPFAEVVNDLESLFKAKRASRTPDETVRELANTACSDDHSPSSLQLLPEPDVSPSSSPGVENNLRSSIGLDEATVSAEVNIPTTSATFEKSPDLVNLLPCITKNRAKPLQRRRPLGRNTMTRTQDHSPDST